MVSFLNEKIFYRLLAKRRDATRRRRSKIPYNYIFYLSNSITYFSKISIEAKVFLEKAVKNLTVTIRVLFGILLDFMMTL